MVGSTLLFLTCAAELIERSTKSKLHPHYAEILALVDAISPTGTSYEVSVEALSKKIRRSRLRIADYLAQEFSGRKLKPGIRDLIAEWRTMVSTLKREAQRARLTKGAKARGSRPEVQSPNPSTPGASSRNRRSNGKKSPGHEP